MQSKENSEWGKPEDNRVDNLIAKLSQSFIIAARKSRQERELDYARGEVWRQKREERSISLEELSARSGIEIMDLLLLEAGIIPEQEVLDPLEAKLGVVLQLSDMDEK